MLFHYLFQSGILPCLTRFRSSNNPDRRFRKKRKSPPILFWCALVSSPLVCNFTLASPPQLATEQHHDKKQVVRLSPEQIEKSGFRLATASAGQLASMLNLPGQVMINTDKLVQVVPKVTGVVREVRKSLGSHVKAGEVLAVIDSRELADTRAAFLAAREQSALALATFQRKEDLLHDKVASQQAYQEAKELLAVAKIAEHTAEQKLLTMGVPAQELRNLSRHPLESSHPKDYLSHYEITAPFSGTILERHITLGEALEPNIAIFQLGDLSTVWADLNVYPKDLPLLRTGQIVTISVSETGLKAQGKIIHVQPLINEETRRTFARVELDNRDGRWQPGLFVNGSVQAGVVEVSLRIARAALQNIGGETVVFVQEEDGFEPRPVTVGRGDDNQVEITAGLKPGERYVEIGSFILKSELEKSEDEHEN